MPTFISFYFDNSEKYVCVKSLKLNNIWRQADSNWSLTDCAPVPLWDEVKSNNILEIVSSVCTL